MKPIVFASGSCRLLSCFDYHVQSQTNHYCNSLHHFNIEWKGGNNFLGKLHTARQHLLLLKFLRNDLYLSLEDQNRLLGMSFQSPWFEKYIENNDYDYLSSLKNIRQEISNCKLFYFEICSMKNALDPKSYFPVAEELEGYRKDLIRTKSKEECRNDILELIQYVNQKFNKPKIILVCHIRNWVFDPSHIYLEDRQSIYEILVEMDSWFENVFYIDPAVFLTKGDLLDDWHYNEQAYCKIYKKICSFHF